MRRKLDATQTEEVLLQYEMGEPLKAIAKDFGIHPVYVRILAKRKGLDWRNRKLNRLDYRREMKDE